MKPLEALPAEVRRVARFRMTCCAADAVPIAVLIRWDKAASLRSDAWVEVRGEVRRETVAGREVTVIDVDPAARDGDGVREIEPPENPYL
jgi:uncharacterized repeat protein (TIGR03943 family)